MILDNLMMSNALQRERREDYSSSSGNFPLLWCCESWGRDLKRIRVILHINDRVHHLLCVCLENKDNCVIALSGHVLRAGLRDMSTCCNLVCDHLLAHKKVNFSKLKIFMNSNAISPFDLSLENFNWVSFWESFERFFLSNFWTVCTKKRWWISSSLARSEIPSESSSLFAHLFPSKWATHAIMISMTSAGPSREKREN